jgi:hypothetical protein
MVRDIESSDDTMTLPRRRTMYVGGDEISSAAMNVYGQPPHAQHVYLPSYYQGQMTYTRKLSVLCFCQSLYLSCLPRGMLRA